ncbi:hypothetical protein Tco_0733597 [Tanacetum coccineum]
MTFATFTFVTGTCTCHYRHNVSLAIGAPTEIRGCYFYLHLAKTSNYGTPYDEEFEASEPLDTRITSLHSTTSSDSTTPLFPNHPLTQIAPTPMLSRPLYYHRTTHIAVRTQPTLSPGFSARLTDAMTLSPSYFHKRYRSSYETLSSSASPAPSSTLPLWKRYQGTFELILDIKIEDDESEAEAAS